ncbi:MAG: FGGY family carbohydrate kinase [Thermoanaerobaculia bacterium]|nr:FGGY family carbohydrate kinase [Thermoanaerobaculia bacterium]
MTGPLVAAVDQGSTSTKAAVLDAGGGCLELLRRPVDRREDGRRVEHDPEAIARDVESLLGELLDRHRVSAIGIATQRSTCLLWDPGGHPLTPALSWQDRTETERVNSLAGHADEVARITGLRLSPHYAAPKLARLLAATTGAARAAERGELVAGTLDAFLLHRLTGEPSTEPGCAGRTLLYDLEGDAWSPRLGRLFGVPVAALPPLRPSAGPRGRFHDVPVTALAGDQQAALLGHGGWRPGVAAAHFGTGAFVLASTGERLRRHPGLLSAVLASTPERRRLQIEGSVNSAGSAVEWAARLAGIDLDRWPDRVLDVERLPWCLPAFAGAGAPWWRPEASGVVAGLGLGHTGDDLLAGVLAGVALRAADCVAAIREAGAEVATLRVSGRLTRLAGLTELLCEAARVEVEVAAEAEAGLTGIARLAALSGAGGEEALAAPPTATRTHRPTWPAGEAERLVRRWRRFVQRSLEGP